MAKAELEIQEMTSGKFAVVEVVLRDAPTRLCTHTTFGTLKGLFDTRDEAELAAGVGLNQSRSPTRPASR